MAELHVQTKKRNTSNLWIWILIALIIIGVVVYFLARNKNNNATTTSDTITYPTSYTVLSQQKLMSKAYLLDGV